jgi:DNA-directed RNA polymerase subunit alpha
MATRLGRFEMPKQVIKDDNASSENYGKFYAEPFEGGYGRTMGNSLRRVLLSSLEGAAVSSVKIKGAPHEYCSLDGIKEDVTEIILNIKKLIFKSYSRDVQIVKIKVDGPGDVTAGDLILPDSLEH